jgi:hypothetical protein
MSRALLVGVSITSFAPPSLAGSGKLEPVPSREAFDEIAVSATVYFEQPRTPADLETVKVGIEGAAKLLCDATEELVSLEQITFVDQDTSKRDADVIWSIQPQRAHGGGLGGGKR